MILRRVILYPIIFIVTIIVSRSLEQLISNKVLSGIITLMLVLGGYIYLCQKRKAKRFSLILEQKAILHDRNYLDTLANTIRYHRL